VEKEIAILNALRDRILDKARLRDGDAVLEVGADRLTLEPLAVAAVDRVGEEGEVFVVDPSPAALEDLWRLAREGGADGRLWFMIGEAAVLPMPDSSVDAVLTRSLPVASEHVAEVAREFHRVLRAGGRISLLASLEMADAAESLLGPLREAGFGSLESDIGEGPSEGKLSLHISGSKG
jgi:ubiquinone/menaquinone biosynthesis C-methylase UbiE